MRTLSTSSRCEAEASEPLTIGTSTPLADHGAKCLGDAGAANYDEECTSLTHATADAAHKILTRGRVSLLASFVGIGALLCAFTFGSGKLLPQGKNWAFQLQRAFQTSNSDGSLFTQIAGFYCESKVNYVGEKSCFEPCPITDVHTTTDCAAKCHGQAGCNTFVVSKNGCYLKTKTYSSDDASPSTVSCQRRPQPCEIHRGDCAGGDVHGHSLRVGDVSDCHSACFATAGCKYFVFWPELQLGHNCFPKMRCDRNTGGDAIAYDVQTCQNNEEKQQNNSPSGKSPLSWLQSDDSSTTKEVPAAHSSGQASNFAKNDGYISAGGSLLVTNMTTANAQKTCRMLQNCQGFTFGGEDTGQPLKIYFKSKWDVSGYHWGGLDWTSYHYTPTRPTTRPPLREKGEKLTTSRASTTPMASSLSSTSTSTKENFLSSDLVFDAETAHVRKLN